jgi:integrase
MATIRRKGERFHVQIRRAGYPSLSRSFGTLADAKEWARQREVEADRGDLGPNRKVLQSITLGDLVERYRDTVVPKLKAHRNETILLTAFLRDPICKKPLSSLSAADFAKYRDQQLERVTSKSLQRMLSPISHMFRVARDEWQIPLRDSPLARLKLKVTDNKRTRRLRAGELDRLLACAADKTGRNPYTILVVQFALATAMRRGEILALRWGQVDIPRQSATVLESKNGLSRVVLMTTSALFVLEQAKSLARDDDEATTKDLVFQMTTNGFMLSWQRLVKAAKITDLHFHDLRHEAISRLFEAGLTVPEVASISGHRTMSMLMRYAHANNSSVRAKLGISTEAVSSGIIRN